MDLTSGTGTILEIAQSGNNASCYKFNLTQLISSNWGRTGECSVSLQKELHWSCSSTYWLIVTPRWVSRWALSDRKRRGYSISGIPITDTWWQQRYFSTHFISLLPLNLMIRPAGWTVTAQRAPAERLTPLSQRSIDSGWVCAAPTSAPRLPFVTCSAGKLKRSFIQLTRPRLEGRKELDPTR